MRLNKPRIARLDEVRITREGDTAIITLLDESVATTRLKLGAELAEMNDASVLGAYNEIITAQDSLATSYRRSAVEIPPGQPQLEYSADSRQWVPRGDVLRCIVNDGGPGNQAVIQIDDQELSLEEFGRMLATYAGWGMRICFVPDDEFEQLPRIEVREPDDEPVPF